MPSSVPPLTLRKVMVELDVTPDCWVQSAAAIGAALAAVIDAYPIGEMRVSRKRIMVRAMFPDTDLPTASQLEAIRMRLRNVAHDAMRNCE